MSVNLIQQNVRLFRREFRSSIYFRARRYCSVVNNVGAEFVPPNESSKFRISDDELDFFYERRIFNTETVFQMLRRQKQKGYLKAGIDQRFSEHNDDPIRTDVPIIVRKLLLDGVLPKSDASLSEKPAPEELNVQSVSLKAQMYEAIEKQALKYPFADVDLPSLTEDTGQKTEGDGRNLGRLLRRKRSAPKIPVSNSVETNSLPTLYGTPNPWSRRSKVICSGCGSILHCRDVAVPGYLPSEVFESCTERELHAIVCQRCTLLGNFDMALKVRVRPEDYVSVVSQMADHQRALALLMVDLVDFPCSIWPGIVDVIGGVNRPIIVVGNKVDLLARDGRGHLARVKTSLEKSLVDCGIDRGRNVKHVCLISAKTGFGVEELITKLQLTWGTKGDIFLIGCTNVGKSSLFNALLDSDLCKTQAIDLVRRATISMWPGTTLNLLRFPILYPTPRRLAERTKRLISLRSQLQAENKKREYQLETTKDIQFATLTGHIGHTFLGNFGDAPRPPLFRKPFDPNDPEFSDGKWVYDTPGVVHKDQITSFLTLKELDLTLPKSIINPRCVVLKPGHTFFLAGLGRIDHVEGTESARLMVFSSGQLPLSVTKTEEADTFYWKYLGTPVLKVPQGGSERLKDFPKLVAEEICLTGIGGHESCADIVLSSAGWCSVCLKTDRVSKFLAYTPGGHGIHVRQPAIMPHAIMLHGKRIHFTPFCQPSRVAFD